MPTHGHLSGFFHPEVRRRRMAVNRTRPCKLHDCNRLRHGAGSLCSLHRNRKHNTGTTNLLQVTVAELKPYRGQARKFLGRNADHPAVQAAKAWLERFLEGRGPLIVGIAEAESEALREAGATPDQLLETTFAVHLIARAEPKRFGRLPERDALRVLGMEVTKLRKRPRGGIKLRKEVDVALGDIIWNGLSLLLTNATSSEDAAWSAEERLQELMAVPVPRLTSIPDEDEDTTALAELPTDDAAAEANRKDPNDAR